MPNWCYNTVTVSHEDPAQIQRLNNAAREGKLFYEFVPLSESGEWDYFKASDMWGAKWDIEKTDFLSLKKVIMQKVNLTLHGCRLLHSTRP